MATIPEAALPKLSRNGGDSTATGQPANQLSSESVLTDEMLSRFESESPPTTGKIVSLIRTSKNFALRSIWYCPSRKSLVEAS